MQHRWQKVLDWIQGGHQPSKHGARQPPAQTEEVTIELKLQLCSRWKKFVWVTSG